MCVPDDFVLLQVGQSAEQKHQCEEASGHFTPLDPSELEACSRTQPHCCSNQPLLSTMQRVQSHPDSDEERKYDNKLYPEARATLDITTVVGQLVAARL